MGKFLFWLLPWQRRPRGETLTMIVHFDQLPNHTQSMKEIHFLGSATYFSNSMIFICNPLKKFEQFEKK